MPRQYDIVTFDCYGTLIDWESGIAGAFARETGLERDAVLRAYAAIEPEVEHDHYRPYREVLAETATRVVAAGAQGAGGRAQGAEAHSGAFLAESLPEWKPFPDTNAALERLRDAGHQLGILSNVDDDLLTATLRHFTVTFDLIITAQQVRSYKPAHRHFLSARERIGSRRWLHAAQSNFHDIVPANALGIPSAWVNRRGETALPNGIPLYEVRDLAGLAELLA